MFRLYCDYYSINDFTKSVLEGTYDRHIYRALYKRAKEICDHRFRHIDPTILFEFEVTLENEEQPLIITTETIESCRKWNPDYSEYERRLVMLLSFIIKDIYGHVLNDLKYEEMEAASKQPVQ
jgi:hypothetical protein